MEFAAGWSEVGTVCGGFPRADWSRPFPSRSCWKTLDLPSSPHAENLHIPPQRLGPPAQIQTPPDFPELHLCPQPRAVCWNVKAAVCGEIQAAIHGSVKPAFSWEIQAAIRGEIQAAVHDSVKPTFSWEIQAAVRGEVKAAFRSQRKTAAIRGEVKVAVRSPRKPAAARGSPKPAIREEI